MAYTIQRVTLDALISALERDLRDFLSLHIEPLVQPRTLLSDVLRKRATERFVKENSESSPDPTELLEYLDLGEEIQAIRSHDSELDAVTKAYIKKYYLGLEAIVPDPKSGDAFSPSRVRRPLPRIRSHFGVSKVP